VILWRQSVGNPLARAFQQPGDATGPEAHKGDSTLTSLRDWFIAEEAHWLSGQVLDSRNFCGRQLPTPAIRLALAKEPLVGLLLR